MHPLCWVAKEKKGLQPFNARNIKHQDFQLYLGAVTAVSDSGWGGGKLRARVLCVGMSVLEKERQREKKGRERPRTLGSDRARPRRVCRKSL